MTSPDTQRVRCCGGASPAAAVEMANATAKARQPEMALMRSNQPGFAAKVPHAERLTFAARARSRARAVLRTSSRRPFSSPHSIRAAGLPSGRVSIRDPTKFVTLRSRTSSPRHQSSRACWPTVHERRQPALCASDARSNSRPSPIGKRSEKSWPCVHAQAADPALQMQIKISSTMRSGRPLASSASRSATKL